MSDYGYSPMTYIEGDIKVAESVRDDGYREIAVDGVVVAHVAESSVFRLIAELFSTMPNKDTAINMLAAQMHAPKEERS
jgi:hypothetical protein